MYQPISREFKGNHRTLMDIHLMTHFGLSVEVKSFERKWYVKSGDNVLS